MKWKVRFLLRHVQRRIRKAYIAKYGSKLYPKFCRHSQEKLEELLTQVPSIGKSIFELNYYFVICYFAWFDTFKAIGFSTEEAAKSIWFINEEYMRSWPKFVLYSAGRFMYSGTHRRRAAQAERMAMEGTLHEFDWKIHYREIDKNTYQIDINECGALKLAKHLGMEELFPTVCRMDYLFSHYFGNGFKRKGTLADGFDCCDSWFRFPGQTQWPVPMDIEGRK